MLGSTADGTSAAGGSVSTVKSSTEVPFHRAAAMRSGENSMARCGCGMASSQRESLLSSPVSLVSGRMVEMLLNESHLIDFLQGSNPVANLGEAAFAQGDHAFFTSDALDLRGGPAIADHFAEGVRQVKKLATGGAAVETGAGAFEATAALN